MKEPRLVSEADLAVLRVNAITDPLTGLYNRRFLVDHLAREISRAERSDGILAVGMMDLKGFKSINDRLGHPVGDSVLVRTARVIRESLRAVDAGCRWGGDEFVLVLPNTDMISALGGARARAREDRGDRRCRPAAAASLDLHYGVASYPQRRQEHGLPPEDRGPAALPVPLAIHLRGERAAAAPAVRAGGHEPPHGVEGAPRAAWTAPVVDVSFGGLAFRAKKAREVAAALEGRDHPEARSRAARDPVEGLALRAPARRRGRAWAAPMSDLGRAGDAAFAAHRAAASGLFTLFTLIAIVLGLGDARPLALAMGGALGSLFLLTRARHPAKSLGDFAAPLAMVVGSRRCSSARCR